ncbi:MAG TPA: hypothetical protein VFE53_01130 [Mucilaginibacter sp.]|jgi:hypothetical protein|nr:hypothetical protein [Mucilaginibacter sp.]
MGLNFIKRITQIRNILNDVVKKIDDDKGLKVHQFLADNLFNNPKYDDSKRLNKHEYQVFSQNGEDGIIREIFNRISTTNKYFIEFGVENGLECNTTNLLYKGWSGLWIEGSPEHYQACAKRFNDLVQSGHLKIKQAFIDAENIQSLFDEAGSPPEPDLLSVDIDYNDYHVWKAITRYKPRVVIVEYNSTFRPDTHFVARYNSKRIWDKTSYFGASLYALEELGREKGYSLVGCVFSGSNAFFVRDDLVQDRFESPFTAENHYEPNRDFLYYKAGHPKNHLPD